MSRRSLVVLVLSSMVAIGVAIAIVVRQEQRHILENPELPHVLTATLRHLRADTTNPHAVFDRQILPRSFTRPQTSSGKWPTALLSAVGSTNVVVIEQGSPACAIDLPPCGQDAGGGRVALSIPFILLGRAAILARVSAHNPSGGTNWEDHILILVRDRSGWHVTRDTIDAQT